MKAIILLCCFLLFAGCASLDKSVYKARRHCDRLFNSKELTTKEKEKWNKRAYITCVSNITNASENNREANNIKASVITQWVALGVGILGNILRNRR